MKNVLKYLISAACIAFVLWGVDYATLLESFELLSPQSIVMAQVILLLGFIPTSFRFVVITHGQARPLTSFRAVVTGIAANTILPARLGEVAKAMVLKNEAKMSMPNAMSAVFWERFADLNCLLLIGIATAALVNMPLALVPLGSLVGGLWFCLLCLRYKPQWLHQIIALIPEGKIRTFILHTLEALSKNLSFSYLIKIGVLSLFIWSLFITFIFYLLSIGMQIHLTNGQIMTVIVASILGVAIPAAPGGIGVYETLVVAALAMAGLSKEQALAIALALHVIQIVLPTIIGLSIMWGGAYTPRMLKDETDTIK